MGRSEADAAVDEILDAAVAATLRARGFRRRRRTWRGDGPGLVQVVTGYNSRFSRTADMMLTLEIGISYLGLGEPDPQRRSAANCGHWHRIGELTDQGTDLWWRFDATNPDQVSAAAQDMRSVWDRFGEPFLDRSTDPTAYLAWLVTSGHTSRHGFDLALALGQHDTAATLIEADLAELRALDLGEPSPADPYPWAHLVPVYAWACEALRRLGQPLPDVDRDRARRALEAARAAHNAGHPHAARPDLIEQLAHHLHADRRP
jgi:hypothetical protein